VLGSVLTPRADGAARRVCDRAAGAGAGQRPGTDRGHPPHQRAADRACGCPALGRSDGGCSGRAARTTATWARTCTTWCTRSTPATRACSWPWCRRWPKSCAYVTLACSRGLAGLTRRPQLEDGEKRAGAVRLLGRMFAARYWSPTFSAVCWADSGPAVGRRCTRRTARCGRSLWAASWTATPRCAWPWRALPATCWRRTRTWPPCWLARWRPARSTPRTRRAPPLSLCVCVCV
jgi:hypothetical protein